MRLFISSFSVIVIAEDQTPRFLDIPHDTEILAGDPVRFQCRVEGEPFPIVKFYRVNSSHHALSNDEIFFSGR